MVGTAAAGETHAAALATARTLYARARQQRTAIAAFREENSVLSDADYDALIEHRAVLKAHADTRDQLSAAMRRLAPLAARTQVLAHQVREDLPQTASELARRVPFVSDEAVETAVCVHVDICGAAVPAGEPLAECVGCGKWVRELGIWATPGTGGSADASHCAHGAKNLCHCLAAQAYPACTGCWTKHVTEHFVKNVRMAVAQGEYESASTPQCCVPCLVCKVPVCAFRVRKNAPEVPAVPPPHPVQQQQPQQELLTPAQEERYEGHQHYQIGIPDESSRLFAHTDASDAASADVDQDLHDGLGLEYGLDSTELAHLLSTTEVSSPMPDPPPRFGSHGVSPQFDPSEDITSMLHQQQFWEVSTETRHQYRLDEPFDFQTQPQPHPQLDAPAQRTALAFETLSEVLDGVSAVIRAVVKRNSASASTVEAVVDRLRTFTSEGVQKQHRPASPPTTKPRQTRRPRSGAGGKGSRRCAHCLEPGHNRRGCPTRKAEEQAQKEADVATDVEVLPSHPPPSEVEVQ